MSLTLKSPSANEIAVRRARVNYLGWAFALLVLLMLGGGAWYYFWGRKPGLAFSVKFAKGDFEPPQAWPAGDGEILVLANGGLKWCSVKDKREKWSAKLPPQPDVDPVWQIALNRRFLRLQEKASALGEKRAALKTQADTKAFNEEVAKYQAELSAARADAAKAPPPRRPSPEDDEEEVEPVLAKVAPPAPGRSADPRIAKAQAVIAQAGGLADDADIAGELGGPSHKGVAARANTALTPSPKAGPQIKAPVPVEIQILEARIAKRTKQLTDMDRTIAEKSKAAKTPLAQAEVAEWQNKKAALLAEQSSDQSAVAKARNPQLPVPAVTASAAASATPAAARPTSAPPAAAVLRAPERLEYGMDDDRKFACVLGDRVWLVDGMHAVAFGRDDGAQKAYTRLAGPMLQAFAGGSVLYVIADAGGEGRQITKIDAAGAMQSIYQGAPKAGSVFSVQENGVGLMLPENRVEFTGAGDSLARVDIRMVSRKTRMRDRIKKGAEAALANTINNSAGNSTDEILAISRMMEADAIRNRGEDREEIDESTYEVTVTRPFEPAKPPFTARVEGMVQVASTSGHDLLACGTKLIALNRENQKRWEATLGAPMSAASEGNENRKTKAIERDGKLYLADGAFLSAFQAADGKTLWRLPNVGIDKIEVDSEGFLYVATRNLKVESLSYEISGDSSPETCSVMKVDPAGGKLLWNAEKLQDVWASGKDLYAYREFQMAQDMANSAFGGSGVPEARTKIFKISRGSGEPLWEWYEPRRPVSVTAFGKSVGMVFGDEVSVISSISY